MDIDTDMVWTDHTGFKRMVTKVRWPNLTQTCVKCVNNKFRGSTVQVKDVDNI